MDKGLWVRAATGHCGAIERVLGWEGWNTGWNRSHFPKQNLQRAGRLVSGPQVKLGFTNHAHFKQILYIVHTLLVTTYIIPNRTIV